MAQFLYKIHVRKDGKEVNNDVLNEQIMSARATVVDKTNGTIISKYNELKNLLMIDDENESKLCDDIAYMTLFRAAWTCELLRRGLPLRVTEEVVYKTDERIGHVRIDVMDI